MTTSEREVVAALGEAIARRVGEPRYQLWFAGKTRFAFEGERLVVGVANHFCLEWLQKQFGPAVRDAAADVFGRPLPVHFVIDPELFQAARREEAVAGANTPAGPTLPRPVAAPDPAPTPGPQGRPERGPQVRGRKRRWRHLHEFVVGTCNRVAYASALSVVESPGQDANPLVIHGPVGTGKTHLLEGIYAGLRKARGEFRVVFVTAEEFTNRFVQAMRLGKLSTFRKHFREADALLIDDLHFLASKKATQEEFLHTFDALLADERQVVLTCDCHPRLSDEFMPELADRLLGGAVWGLTAPDRDTRLGLLRKKSLRGPEEALPDVVLQYIADNLRGNVRELEGALNGLRHLAKVSGRKIDVAVAREALADLLRHSVRVLQPTDVDRAVCVALRLEPGTLQSSGRSWQHAHPRMLAIYLARKHTAATYSEAGLYFGNRNHSTAVAAEKKVRRWLDEDAALTLGGQQLRVREIVERAERELCR